MPLPVLDPRKLNRSQEWIQNADEIIGDVTDLRLGKSGNCFRKKKVFDDFF
jgi:hypothetical protein